MENEKLAVDKKVASQQNDSNNVQSVISLTKAEWLVSKHLKSKRLE